MKKYTLIIALIFPMFLIGQTLEDALRYSYSNNYATARSLGVGGAFGAMGADFSAISLNPATLGNYWKSEFSISMGMTNGYANSFLSENTNNIIDNKFTFDNIGFVTNSRKDTTGWLSTNFAIGLNKTNRFNNYLDVSGSTNGSAIESPDLFDQESIDFSPYDSIPINKSQIISESGSINEMVFAFGGNYNKKFLFGISFGIPFLNYSTDRLYQETAPDTLRYDPDFYFNSLKYKESYTTVGVGFNVKLGAIYILPSNFRLGLAIHSPTGFKLKDDYAVDFSAISDNYDIDSIANSYYFDYKLRTPWRFIGSIGKVFKTGKLAGFINVDAEYVSYASSRYNFRKYSNEEYDIENEKIQNRAIRNKLKSTFNFKLGSEIGYAKYRVRLGGALNGNPFSDSDGFDPSFNYSFGLGYRSNGYYIDLGYLGSDKSYTFSPYEANDSKRTPNIAIDKHIDKFILTLGIKF